VATGNRINIYDIASIEKSKYAFPASVLKNIHGETTMGWTAFVAKMKDGKLFGFGTSFSFDFFQMPENYSADDIVEIINHSCICENKKICEVKQGPHFTGDYKESTTYRERPFFDCYIDGL